MIKNQIIAVLLFGLFFTCYYAWVHDRKFKEVESMYTREKMIATTPNLQAKKDLTCYNFKTDQTVKTHGLYCVIYFGDKPITNYLRSQIIRAMGEIGALPKSFHVLPIDHKFQGDTRKIQVQWGKKPTPQKQK